ncbi:hypothetical protein Droror1_Dr00017889 [Drosera rotundifolia]
MAAPLHHLALLALLSLLLPILSHSLTPCDTLAFPSYTTCLSLPTLAATLHYTFHSSNSTLSTAFTAAPSSPTGWIAWGINPASRFMFGTQALLAYVSSNGSAFVGTYNITSTDVAPGKISYKVTGVSAEYNGGNVTVFGDWAIPKGVEVINQVWQVGPAVAAGGRPAKHDMKPANLGSVGTLRLVSGGGGSASAAPAPAPKSGGGKKSAGGTPAPNGGAVVRSCAAGVMMGVLLGVFGLTMF